MGAAPATLLLLEPPPPPLGPRLFLPLPLLLLPRGPRRGDVASVLPRYLQVGALIVFLVHPFLSSAVAAAGSGSSESNRGGGTLYRGARPPPLAPGNRSPRNPPPLPLLKVITLTAALHPRHPLAACDSLRDEQPRERVGRRGCPRRARALDEEEPSEGEAAAEGGVDPGDSCGDEGRSSRARSGSGA